MRKQIFNIVLAWSLIGMMSSCYDDKGNYDYIKLDEVVIDTTGSGILSAYSLARYERLTIEPKVFFNGQEVNDDEEAPGRLFMDHLHEWNFGVNFFLC